jgi:hypothetical protein
LAAKGLVEKWLDETDGPLGFLLHDRGADSMIDTAQAALKDADRATFAALFGHLQGIGLDRSDNTVATAHCDS